MKIKTSLNSNTLNITLINYADKNYSKAQKINTNSAIKKGCFKKVISYSPEDLDRSFYLENKDILDEKKGNGYWLWKPYFIKKTLEDIEDGDCFFYCDSGSYFVNSIGEIIESVEKDQDIILFELQQIEKKWTKRDCFVLMECDDLRYSDTKQRMATFSLWRKSDFTMRFIDSWLTLAKDKRLITDEENSCGFSNYSDFINHRHDQSIFSLLTKKYQLKAYRDPSQFGNNYIEIYPASKYPQIIISTRQKNISFIKLLKKKLRPFIARFRKS